MRVLVAGIGNIFYGDDAFGCEVAQRLMRAPLPAEVKVADYAIRGFDLANDIAGKDGRGFDGVILVDAVQRGGAPGTLYVIEPDSAVPDLPVEGHDLTPANVMSLVSALGGSCAGIQIVGCEPARFEGEEEGEMGLSPAVEEAVPHAMTVVMSLVEKVLAGPARATVPNRAEV